MSREPSHRALIAIVQSTNPATRPSRNDDPRTAREKQELQDDLIEMAKQKLKASPSTRVNAAQEQDIIDTIRRRLARRSRQAVQEFDALYQKLKDMPNPPAELSSILGLLADLSFTGPAQTLEPSSSRLASVSSTRSAARASLLGQAEGQARFTRPDGATSSAASRYSESRPSSRATNAVVEETPPRRGEPLTPRAASSSSDAASTTARLEPAKLSSLDMNRKAAAAEVHRIQEAGAEMRRVEMADQRRDKDALGTQPKGKAAVEIDLGQLGLGKVPKATLLERWRSANSSSLVPEQDLLRDVIFILQGINGRYVRFEEIQQKIVHDPGVIRANPNEVPEPMIKIKFVENDEGAIPLPTRHLIHRLAEAGKHYQRITAFTRHQATIENSGRVMQSLCHFLDGELTHYYTLICDLEAQLNEGPADAVDVPSEHGAARAAAQSHELDHQPTKGLTLKKVAVETEGALLRMRLMSSLVEGAQHTHGGSLVSVIHSYTYNGDPFIKEFAERLLEEVSRSFFTALSRWIYEGELHDPFKEFFVELNPDSKAATQAVPTPFGVMAGNNDFVDEIDAASVWESKFRFRSELVPTFLAESFARKIFSSGKSLNFIRYSCGDLDWKETRNLIASKTTSNMKYTDLVGLERTIDSVHSTVSKRLLDIFLDKFKLQEHLRAINEYMLLTKGDFADVLLETLSPILYKPAGSIYRHALTAALETAIRGSNAQYDDSDITRRLDARVLEVSSAETGWDAFTLDYRVDSPVNTVLDSEAMAEYQQIFTHLWKMKRVELCLVASFGRMTIAANGLLRIKKSERDEEIQALRQQAHRALGLLHEMTHFIRQLQGYNQLEVISYSWQDLESFFEKRSGDLDVLIAAHRSYLNSLHGKILLRGGKRGAADYLANELRVNFDTIIAFASGSDELSSFIGDELARRKLGDMETEDHRLPNILRMVGEKAESFRERTTNIILRLERHSNLVIRDLSVRLNFNGYYTQERDRERGQDGPSSGR